MVMVLRPTATILALTLAGLASATDVSVQHDATYFIDSKRGPICSGSGAAPAGTACPLKGDAATNSCLPGLPSYTESGCVAPVDAQCVVVTGTTWGCAFPQSGETPCPLLPLPSGAEADTPCPSFHLPNEDAKISDTGYSDKQGATGSSELSYRTGGSMPTKSGTGASNNAETSATKAENSHEHYDAASSTTQADDSSHYAAEESEDGHDHYDSEEVGNSEGYSSGPCSERIRDDHGEYADEGTGGSYDAYTTEEGGYQDEYRTEGASTGYDKKEVTYGRHDMHGSETHGSHDEYTIGRCSETYDKGGVVPEDGCDGEIHHGVALEVDDSHDEHEGDATEEIYAEEDAVERFQDTYDGEVVKGNVDVDKDSIEQVDGSREENAEQEDGSSDDTSHGMEDGHDAQNGESHSYEDHGKDDDSRVSSE